MGIKGVFRRIIKSKSFSLAVVLCIIAAFFTIINSNYLSGSNIRGIMHMMSLTGIIGVGTALLLMGGGINLAAGAEGCFIALLIAMMMRAGLPWVLALFIGLLFGMCAGLINSFFVNILNFFGFIATLGMASVYTGLGLIISTNTPIPISNQSFWKFAETMLPIRFYPTSYMILVPMSFVVMVAIMVIYAFILNKTRFGRSILMCGGNRQAARLAGLNPKKVTTILYMNSGVLSTIAGALLSSRLHNAAPDALGSSAIEGIAASVLGGVSFVGGSGSISGLFFGTLLLNALSNGLIVIDMPSYWQLVLRGMVLIIALTLDYFSNQARIASLKRARIAQAAAR